MTDFEEGVEAMRKEVLAYINAAGLTALDDERAEAEFELQAAQIAVTALRVQAPSFPHVCPVHNTRYRNACGACHQNEES